MKKVFALVLTLALLLSATAAGGDFCLAGLGLRAKWCDS